MKAANSCKLCTISDVDNICNLLFLLEMTVTQNTREPFSFDRLTIFSAKPNILKINEQQGIIFEQKITGAEILMQHTR